MKTLLSISAVAILFAAGAQAQPVVHPGGVVNAASYAAAGLPNAGIAQGSMFVVFGSRIGPAQLAQATTLPLPLELGGVSIQVVSGGVTVNAPMVYSSAGQVAAIMPSSTVAGNARLTLRASGVNAAAVDVRVVPSSFGIFTRNQAGSGPAIVQNYVSQTVQPVNAVNIAAHPGQVMILWGTGLGPITGSDSAAPPVGNLPASVEVLLGSRRARILYQGRAPGLPGIDQVNFEVPRDVELGCYVPLAVRAGNVTSNYGSLSIAASGNTCSDPVTGLTAAELERALAKGYLDVGNISLTRFRMKLDLQIPGFPSEFKIDSGGASFGRYDAARLAASSSALGGTPIGSCTVYSTEGLDTDLDDPVQPQGLEAGASLTVTGPRGVKQLARQAPGAYSGELGGGFPGMPGTTAPDYLEPGSYTVAGTGGANVGAFTARLAMPAALNWTNAGAIGNIARSQNLTIAWTGGDANSIVMIFGSSLMANEKGAGFMCLERASRGTFTIDAAVLSALPASATTGGEASGALGVGMSASGEGNRFQATGLDFGYINYADFTLKNVNFQ